MQRIERPFSMIVLLTCMWAGIQPAEGQYTSNYQTNTISGVTNYWAGDYVVGSNTLADALLIRNAGVLSNANGYVGYLPASSSNYVMVAGKNSVWNSATWLELGYAGPGNSLVISNGGCVVAADAKVGDASTSCGNTALITGAGSVWNNSTCRIGDGGSSNRMIINKGGRVTSTFGYLGFFGSATGNTVWISDSNSVWDVSAVAATLWAGFDGPGNSIVVTNGGQILGYWFYVGASSSGNSVLVTSPGSSISVNCYIYTGYQGDNNSFTVANGAAVSDKYCYISDAAGSSNNAVLVTGTNSSWHNSYSVLVGFDGVNGTLTISNGAAMSNGGAFGVSHDGALGCDSTSSNNFALVTGGGSVLNCADNMYVGLNGPVNSLVISNGGQVINTTGYVGSNPGSDGNSALVAGAHSVWANSSDFYVGYFTVGNSLVISSGGRVINGYGFVGEVAGSDGNSVLVTGAGSVWTNYDDVYVGDSGAGNSLVISNGGWVINDYGYVGEVAGSDNNSVLVTGAGSVWSNYDDAYAGGYGAGNSLVISNGGWVSDDMGVIGYDTNSFYNQVVVTGAGSVWSNTTAVFVGYYGPSNSLVISNGGLVADGWGLIGEADSTSSDNTVWVGPGGVWRNQQLVVGDLGSENTLFVEGGSVFVTTNMVVGFNSFYCDNLVQLDSGQITVTNQTHDAVLEVYDGTFVLNGGTLRVDTLIVTNDCAQFLHVGGTLIYRSLQLNPNQSAVGDGIPNLWKQQYGFDPLDPNVAGADPDHDGANNLQEYLAGTNPTNAASVFHFISAAKTNMDVRVTWSTVGGHNYVLQTNGNLGAGAFADFGPVISVGGTNEGMTNYLDHGAATNHSSRFYRVRLAQ
jgi:T5SS/PEP-CTERM-associated repeat protein